MYCYYLTNGFHQIVQRLLIMSVFYSLTLTDVKHTLDDLHKVMKNFENRASFTNDLERLSGVSSCLDVFTGALGFSHCLSQDKSRKKKSGKKKSYTFKDAFICCVYTLSGNTVPEQSSQWLILFFQGKGDYVDIREEVVDEKALTKGDMSLRPAVYHLMSLRTCSGCPHPAGRVYVHVQQV